MAAFWAVFTFGGSSPAINAHGSLAHKEEIQIQRVCIIQRISGSFSGCFSCVFCSFHCYTNLCISEATVLRNVHIFQSILESQNYSVIEGIKQTCVEGCGVCTGKLAINSHWTLNKKFKFKFKVI
jgi:hypothetical protein